MKKETAIAFAGNANRLAKLLGINRAAITQWGQNVPPRRVDQLKTLKPEWFDTLVAPV
jgi:DNA-binding transcriptional regulator YdaS (Cro superfamily)